MRVLLRRFDKDLPGVLDVDVVAPRPVEGSSPSWPGDVLKQALLGSMLLLLASVVATSTSPLVWPGQGASTTVPVP